MLRETSPRQRARRSTMREHRTGPARRRRCGPAFHSRAQHPPSGQARSASSPVRPAESRRARSGIRSAGRLRRASTAPGATTERGLRSHRRFPAPAPEERDPRSTCRSGARRVRAEHRSDPSPAHWREGASSRALHPPAAAARLPRRDSGRGSPAVRPAGRGESPSRRVCRTRCSRHTRLHRWRVCDRRYLERVACVLAQTRRAAPVREPGRLERHPGGSVNCHRQSGPLSCGECSRGSSRH